MEATDQGSHGRPRVLILGGGFAGLAALHALVRSGAEVTVIDRNIYSTFQPLLYEVATGGLTGADVAYPLWTATRADGASFRKDEPASIDLDQQVVTLAGGDRLSYDYLIIATGIAAAFFGVTGAAEHALSLYTRRDAIRLRNSLMVELERRNEGHVEPDMEVTVVGGGATGVELAGSLAELRNYALPSVFPDIDRSRLHVRLIEMGPALLGPFRGRLQKYALRQLTGRGVEVLLKTAIAEVRPGSVVLADGTERRSDITVWAAGVAGPKEPWSAGLGRGKGGRIEVDADLRVKGMDRVFAVGDIAVYPDKPVPQLAQPAIQQGRHAGEQIVRMMAGKATQPFRYSDRGTMATIGRRSAVAQLRGGLQLRGTPAWLAWLGLHLVFLLGPRNRVAALVNLSWRYLTWSRGGGILIGDDVPTRREPVPNRVAAGDERPPGRAIVLSR